MSAAAASRKLYVKHMLAKKTGLNANTDATR